MIVGLECEPILGRRFEVEILVLDLSQLVRVQVQILQLSVNRQRVGQLKHGQLVQCEPFEQRI